MSVVQRGGGFATNRPPIIPQPIPRGVERDVIVLTVDGHPTVRVACGNLRSEPRRGFVVMVVRRVYGLQDNGEPHQWELAAEVKKAPAITIPIDNPKVHDWMEEKVNG